MSEATLVCYTFGSQLTPVQRSRFKREFLGYTDRSNHGKFIYKRKGLLGRIPHVKLIRSVFIIREEDKEHVLQCLEKYGATVFLRTVQLTEGDGRILNTPPE